MKRMAFYLTFKNDSLLTNKVKFLFIMQRFLYFSTPSSEYTRHNAFVFYTIYQNYNQLYVYSSWGHNQENCEGLSLAGTRK